MAKERRKKKEKPQLTEPTFMQQLSLVPQVVMQRFLGQIGAALVIVLLTIFLLFYFRTWQFCIGFLIALYIAYLAMDVVWS